MDRRDFLRRTGLALGGAALTSTAGCATTAPGPAATDPWEAFRGEFELSRDEIHLSMFLLAPHPRPVREAIAMYRRAFDENPFKAFKQFAPKAEAEVRAAAAAQRLIDEAGLGRDVLVLAHGYFNHMVGRALKAHGWRLVHNQGFKYWSQRRFEKR